MLRTQHLLVFAGLILFLFVAGCDDDKNPVDPHETHNEAEGLVLKMNDTNFVVVEEGQVKEGKIVVQVSQTTAPITVRFLDPDGDEFIPTEEHSSLSLTVVDGALATTQIDADDPWSFTVTGVKTGTTALEIQLMHGDHADFTAPSITLEVTP